MYRDCRSLFNCCLSLHIMHNYVIACLYINKYYEFLMNILVCFKCFHIINSVTKRCNACNILTRCNVVLFQFQTIIKF